MKTEAEIFAGTQPGPIQLEVLRQKASGEDGLRVACTGTSMAPTVDVGQVVVVRHATRARVGEVVVFASAELDSLIMHRVVLRVPGVFAHVGDARGAGQPMVALENRLIGRCEVAPREPRLGAQVRAAARLAAHAGRRLARRTAGLRRAQFPNG